ncbi:hypothetical protein FQA47_002541 [Oryzias melastigma]|uniref:Uncharacterized protein n=1 Tax=Oryzias melastigma TaxID=30732 RepID=A0A834F9E2_ORYME|nr:hypothetical protein FQA47_002541 [Oryzias melastigma]
MRLHVGPPLFPAPQHAGKLELRSTPEQRKQALADGALQRQDMKVGMVAALNPRARCRLRLQLCSVSIALQAQLRGPNSRRAAASFRPAETDGERIRRGETTLRSVHRRPYGPCTDDPTVRARRVPTTGGVKGRLLDGCEEEEEMFSASAGDFCELWRSRIMDSGASGDKSLAQMGPRFGRGYQDRFQSPDDKDRTKTAMASSFSGPLKRHFQVR